MPIRKALLVGINAYPSTPLHGCINDVMQMKDLLQRYYGFQEGDIHLLLDDAATMAGIKTGLEWLAAGGVEPDAARVFHFSGHGSYVADQNGDEPDGRDECLVPYDYKSVGMLTDDALKALYDRFPPAGNLTLVMDCCFSGSNNRAPGDVRYRFIPVSAEERARIDAAAKRFADDQREYIARELEELQSRSLSGEDLQRWVARLIARFRKQRFGDVRVREANVLLAGCRDDQQAADAYIGGGYHGAFTYYLAEAITKSRGQITYRELVGQTGNKLDSENLVQIPQLECRGGREQRLAFRPFV